MICNKQICALLLLLLPNVSYASEPCQKAVEAGWEQASQKSLEIIQAQIQQTTLLRGKWAEAATTREIKRIERQVLYDRGTKVDNKDSCPCKGCLQIEVMRRAQNVRFAQEAKL